VWDDHVFFFFFDPTFGGTAKTPAGEQSAAALLASHSAIRWTQLGAVPASTGEPLDPQSAYDGVPTPRFNGHLVYPEPWLYTRVGRKLAPGPFNGLFVVVGPPSLRLAVGHWLLLGAIVATSLAALAYGIALLLRLAEPARARQNIVVPQGVDDAAE
jgi:hypothetical protein